MFLLCKQLLISLVPSGEPGCFMISPAHMTVFSGGYGDTGLTSPFAVNVDHSPDGMALNHVINEQCEAHIGVLSKVIDNWPKQLDIIQ